MNSQIELMKKAIDDASHEKGIVWNKVTWYSWTLAVILFFFVIPAIAFYVGMQYQALQEDLRNAPASVGGNIACTEEAKMCPDGSSVGRTGENCSFALCPGETPPSPTVGGVKKSPTPKAPPVVCTADAKLCADGTSVGRVAPKCEFAKCPSSSGRPELKGKATLGPTCPVVDMKNSGACADKPYEGSLEVWTEKGGFIKSFATKIDGTFATELTPGRYVLKIPKTDRPIPTLSPISFVMEQGKLTELSPRIDTGIR
jgi:hypothetical protein